MWRTHHRAGWRSQVRSQIPDVQASASATGESPRVLLPPRAAWQGPRDESNPAQDANRVPVMAEKAVGEQPHWGATVVPGSDAGATPRSAAGSLEPGASPSLPCHHRESPPDAAGCSACWAAWQACWAASSASADGRLASAAEESPSAGGPSASAVDLPAWPDAPPASPVEHRRRRRHGPSRACHHRRPRPVGRRPGR